LKSNHLDREQSTFALKIGAYLGSVIGELLSP
jgi:hypothetical protein